MAVPAGARILRSMTPSPVRTWLVPLLVATIGIYVLLMALAIGALPSGHWALYLIAVSVACFVGAGASAARGLVRRRS
jgi:ABC-type Co2+ transport system permease subunit